MLTPTSATAMRPGAYKRMISTKSVDVAIGSGRGEVDEGEGSMDGGDRENEADKRWVESHAE